MLIHDRAKEYGILNDTHSRIPTSIDDIVTNLLNFFGKQLGQDKVELVTHFDGRKEIIWHGGNKPNISLITIDTFIAQWNVNDSIWIDPKVMNCLPDHFPAAVRYALLESQRPNSTNDSNSRYIPIPQRWV